MSLLSTVRMYPLPEYEPPRLPYPPDPDEPDYLLLEFPPPPPAPVTWLLGDGPVWDEAGQTRDRLRRLLCLILEVLDGRRPIGQLRGIVGAHLYESLLTRSRHTTGRQHRLRSLHTCRPVSGVIELCATVTVSTPGLRRDAFIAIAARMVHHAGTWRCTTLRPLYPRGGTP